MLPPKAEVFVNREAPIRFFEDAAFAIPDDRSIVRVFYGIGGQGKTALCRELFRKTSRKEDPSYALLRCAELDLHDKPKTDPVLFLVWIRNEFAKAGVEFATFDLTLKYVWKATRSEQHFPKLVNARLGKSAEAFVRGVQDAVQVLAEMVEKAVETIPGLGIIITKGIRWVIGKTRRAYLERTRECLNKLYRQGELKRPGELSELLPWMLAQDLNHHLAKHPKERFVLFIDEYERVFDEGGAGARQQQNPFHRHMQTLVKECKGLLAALFSRERLPRGTDGKWHEYLEDAQHLLGGLAEADADEWLREIHIDHKKIRQAMINGAREEPKDGAPVYSLMLDLQVAHWRSLIADQAAITPELFHVKAETFEERCRELVERVLRDYRDELRLTLEHLSVANRFDREAFEHVVDTFRTALPFASFDNIANLSFLTESEDGYLTMHRAFAEAIRTTLDEERLRISVNVLFEHYEIRAEIFSPRDVTDDKVSALMEAAYLRREAGLDHYVDWLDKLSTPLTEAARYTAVEQLWRDSLYFIEDKFGSDHAHTVTAYNKVAYNLHAQDRFKEAQPFFGKVLEIQKRVLGEEHLDTVSSYNNAAANLNAHGKYNEAQPLYRKALKIRKQVLGTDHHDTASSYNNVAFNLNAQERYNEAEPLYRMALKIRNRVLGEDHRDTVSSYDNVAANLDGQGRYDEAEPLHRKALEIKNRVLGEDHRDTAMSYDNVAYNLNAQGRHEEAEPLFRKALMIREQSLGKNHPSTASSYNNVARNLVARGRHEEAEPLFRKAREIMSRVPGEQHP